MVTQPVLRLAGRVNIVFGIILTFVLLGLSFRSFAVINTHNWQESHRGYSIELVPGTNEYVAAGTVYDVSKPNETGWHFMHLNATGNILSSRIAWSQAPLQQMRVVDIAVENANKFWITIEARIAVSSIAKDYVYVHGVDINGTDLGLNPDITVFCNGPDVENIYPTHSYFAANALFVCGYGAPGGTEFPNDGPNKFYGSKFGMLMKIDVNASPVTHTESFWDTWSSYNDFDMALRLSPYSATSDFPLLMTGATNGSDQCGALIGKVDNLGSIIGIQDVHYDYGFSENEELKGVFGVDARAQVGNPDEFGDIVLLINKFDELRFNPFEKTWGVVRIHDDLSLYPNTVNSVLLAPGLKGWANQFLNLHMVNNNPPIGDHIDVVGQQYDEYSPLCVNLPGGALAPSKVNVNPFIAEVEVGNIWFKVVPYNGYLSGGAIKYRYFYPSTKGTKAANMNYLPGTLSYGSALEDASRLYTFASLERYYDVTANQSIPDVGMIAPIGENPMVTNNNLLTRFIGVTTGLFEYEETSCSTHTKDCITPDLGGVVSFTPFSFFNEACTYHPGYNIFTLENNTDVPLETDCSGGYYKPTGVQSHYLTGDGLKIYPNPATTELYVQFSQVMNGKKFQFTLMDMTGKNVFNSNGQVTGDATRIALPNLAAGMYMATVVTEGKREMKKITIQ